MVIDKIRYAMIGAPILNLFDKLEEKIANSKGFVLFSAILLQVLALVVMFGWHINNTFLIQLHPDFAAMQYNTALSFLFFGAAIWSINSYSIPLARLLCLLGTLIGLFTLIQYLTGINLEIDELIVTHYIDLESLYPGRMSPNTAICFLLSGIAFLTSSKPWRSPQFSIILALIVSGMGMVSLIGYIFGLHNTYGWGNLPQMAIHTSIGFLFLGFAFAIQGLNLDFNAPFRKLRTREFFLLSITAALVVSLLIIDIQMPLGVAAGLPYMLLLTLSWKMTNPKAALNLALLTTIMVIVGYYFSPHGAENYVAILNRIYSVSAIWGAAYLLFRVKADQEILKEKNKVIENKHLELDRTSNALQVSHEELAATNEELKVTNEELIEQQIEMRSLNERLNEKGKLLEQGEKFAKLNTWIYDPQNGITEYSQAFLNVHDFEPGEIDGFTATSKSISRIHPDDQARMKKFRHQDQSHLPISAEYRYLLKDGSIKWLRDTISLIDEENRLIGITQDITDELKAKENLNQAYEKLYLTTKQLQSTNQELIEAHSKLSTVNVDLEARVFERTRELEKTNSYLDNFVHATAHDLRSPVANLKQISELMQILQKEEDPIVDKLSTSVERLDRTVSGLIEIIDAQKVEPHSIKQINVLEKFESFVEDFSELIEEKGAELQCDFEVESLMYLESFYDCIFRNLFQNALKYSSPQRNPQIHISTYREDEFVVLKVQDNGIGINLQEAGDRLFRAFKRFTNQAQGNGIGLHLVKSLAEKNDGKVKVESELGQGTTFYIYLNEYRIFEHA